MGLDYTVYVGPYVECQTHEIDATEQIWACSHTTCSKYGKRREQDIKFCPECGYECVSLTIKTKTKAISSWKVSEDIDEALYCANHVGLDEEKIGETIIHTWAPNVSRERPREFSIDPHQSSSVKMSLQNAAESEMMWFKRKFAKEIEHLNNTYGPKNVSLQWGLISTAY